MRERTTLTATPLLAYGGLILTSLFSLAAALIVVASGALYGTVLMRRSFLHVTTVQAGQKALFLILLLQMGLAYTLYLRNRMAIATEERLDDEAHLRTFHRLMLHLVRGSKRLLQRLVSGRRKGR